MTNYQCPICHRESFKVRLEKRRVWSNSKPIDNIITGMKLQCRKCDNVLHIKLELQTYRKEVIPEFA